MLDPAKEGPKHLKIKKRDMFDDIQSTNRNEIVEIYIRVEQNCMKKIMHDLFGRKGHNF